MGRPMTLEECNRWMLKLGDIGKRGWTPQFMKIGAKLVREHTKTLRKHSSPDGVPWAKTFAKPLPKMGDIAPKLYNFEGCPYTEIRTQRIKTRQGQIAAIVYAKSQGQTERPWPKIGETAPMMIHEKNDFATVETGLIKTKEDKLSAKLYREKMGPAWRPQPALIRKGPSQPRHGTIRKNGLRPTMLIWNFLTSFNRAVRPWLRKDMLIYGFKAWPGGMQWLRSIQSGSPSWKAGKLGWNVPARPMVGWTKTTIDFAVKVIGDKVDKYLRKLG